MKLTKIESIRRCEKLWREISNNTEIDNPKSAIVKELWPYEDVFAACWACEYAKEKCKGNPGSMEKRCPICPIKKCWGKAEICTCVGSPYYKWDNFGRMMGYNSDAARKEATIIADFCLNEIKKYEAKLARDRARRKK